MEDLNRFEIKLKKLDYIYENLLGGLIGIFGLSTIIYFTFNGIVDSKNLTTWFILNIVLVLMRLFLLKTYKKSIITSNNYLMYYILFFVLAVLNAMVWGMGAFYILPADLEYQLVLLLLVAGLTAGSTISLASEKEMFYMYLFFTMTPFIYVFYIGDSTATKIVSVSMTLWVVILILTVRKISKSVINNMLLAYENKNLIIQLEEKVEEANIANRAKSEFLSVMSHEIRTPLNAILGFVHILKEKEEDTKKREYLDIIDKSSVVLTKVINDILDLTKIESEKLTLEMIEFSPKTEFNSVYSLFEQNSIEKGVIFINSISNELPEFVKSDIVRIKQILSNLISNAIKFTTEGNRVELKINFNDDKSLMCFEIIDEGIGIPKEDVETITEPFMQADSSVTRKYGGTGLGLSIVANLLRLLGSELKIESEVDKGSKFSFELEVSKVETIKEDEDKFVEDSFEGKRILVAEDYEPNQLLISFILDEMNIDAVIAEDGLRAQEIFKEHKFDMVLMDINMPNKNGIDAMKDIKDFEKKSDSFTPIVALTANAVGGDKEKFLDEGFDDYLAKPIDTQELIKICHKFFD